MTGSEQAQTSNPSLLLSDEIERETQKTLTRRVRTAAYAIVVLVGQLVFFTVVFGAPVYDVDFWARIWSQVVSVTLLVVLHAGWMQNRARLLAFLYMNAMALCAASSAVFGGDFDGNAGLLASSAVVAGAIFPWGLRAQAFHAGMTVVLLAIMWNAPVDRPDGYAQLGVYSSATAGIGLSLLLAFIVRRGFVDAVKETAALRDARDEIRSFNSDLERKVAERTRELDEALADQQSFTYAVSHDLRQPLRHVDGYLRFFDDGSVAIDAEHRQLLDRAYSGLARAGRMIDALLQISRLGTSRVSRSNVDISGMAEEILSELCQDEPRRLVTTRVQPGMVASAEPRLVRALLDQLLSNAWKFTSRSDSAHIFTLEPAVGRLADA